MFKHGLLLLSIIGQQRADTMANTCRERPLVNSIAVLLISVLLMTIMSSLSRTLSAWVFVYRDVTVHLDAFEAVNVNISLTGTTYLL